MTNKLVGAAIAIAITVLMFQAYWVSIAQANGISHLVCSALVVSIMFALTDSLLLAVGVAIGLGVFKELGDPTFSQLDIVMDLIGVLVAMLMVNVFRIKRSRL